MKYYTATIPPTLAEKLKEKGMPIEYHPLFTPACEGADQSVGLIRPMYADVFDWLMEKGLVLHLWAGGDEHTKSNMVDLGYGVKNAVGEGNFYEAANAAIEKALTLI